MTTEKVIDKETHYQRGREIAPVSGIIVETNWTPRFKKELATIAAKEYILARFNKIYGHLNLKEEDQLEKIFEISNETKTLIIKYTRQALTIEHISRIEGMPSVSQIKEIIDSDRFFSVSYEDAVKSSAKYIIDEKHTLIKDFTQNNLPLHLDAFAVSVAGNMMSSLIKEKNPEKYASNNKITINSNTDKPVYSESEIRMMVEHCLESMDRKDLQRVITKAQNLLDDLIAKEMRTVS